MGVNERFGRAVALRRLRAGITQGQLAAAIGLSRTSIANIEQGRQQALLHHAVAIATALGVSLQELIDLPEPVQELRKAHALDDMDDPLSNWARGVLRTAPR